MTNHLRRIILCLLLVAGGIAVAGSAVQAQVVRPPDVERQYYRAEAAWRSGSNVLEAKVRVDNVIKALPNDAAARKLRAQVLLTMKRADEALVDARRAVELNPADGEAQLILSEAARLSGQTDLARQALNAAANLIGDDASLQLRLSWNAMELGLLEQAERFAQNALRLNDQAAASYYQLARVYLRQNQNDAAANLLARGFSRSLLEARTVRQDAILSQIARHPALRTYLND